jgi:hypothetical protein
MNKIKKILTHHILKRKRKNETYLLYPMQSTKELKFMHKNFIRVTYPNHFPFLKYPLFYSDTKPKNLKDLVLYSNNHIVVRDNFDYWFNMNNQAYLMKFKMLLTPMKLFQYVKYFHKDFPKSVPNSSS